MYYIVGPDERPNGYVHLSESRQWVPWLAHDIPAALDPDVRRRLNSNLKHLLVGLELKSALISGHRRQDPGQRNVLFEPYYQNLISEFCVAASSVIEGLGAAHWLDAQAADGGAVARRNQRSSATPGLRLTCTPMWRPSVAKPCESELTGCPRS